MGKLSFSLAAFTAVMLVVSRQCSQAPLCLSFLAPFFILNSVLDSIKFGLLYWQQNILYFWLKNVQTKHQTSLISTINSKWNFFLRLHHKICFSEPSPAFSTNQKGLVHIDIFCESRGTSEEHDCMSTLSVGMISYFYYSRLSTTLIVVLHGYQESHGALEFIQAVSCFVWNFQRNKNEIQVKCWPKRGTC